MKLTINMDNIEANATVDTFVSAARDFGFDPTAGMVKACSKARDMAKVGTSERFPGGYCSIEMDENCQNDTRDYTITMAMESEAYVEAMVIGIKAAKYIAPIVHAGRTLLSTFKTITDGVDDVFAGITAKYKAKFVPAKKYAIATLINEDLELASKVLVEDDGLDNIRLVTSVDVGKSYDVDVIMKLFNAARERGEATKDSQVLRYPLITFESISLEDALAMVNDVKGLRADYEGMIRQKDDKYSDHCKRYAVNNEDEDDD